MKKLATTLATVRLMLALLAPVTMAGFVVALAVVTAAPNDQPAVPTEFKPQPIPANVVERFQQLQTEASLMEFTLCNTAGLLRKDCLVNWQTGVVLKVVKPKPVDPKVEPTKQPEGK